MVTGGRERFFVCLFCLFVFNWSICFSDGEGLAASWNSWVQASRMHHTPVLCLLLWPASNSPQPPLAPRLQPCKTQLTNMADLDLKCNKYSIRHARLLESLILNSNFSSQTHWNSTDGDRWTLNHEKSWKNGCHRDQNLSPVVSAFAFTNCENLDKSCNLLGMTV